MAHEATTRTGFFASKSNKCVRRILASEALPCTRAIASASTLHRLVEAPGFSQRGGQRIERQQSRALRQCAGLRRECDGGRAIAQRRVGRGPPAATRRH